jgi:uncharacterized protein (TIGR03435 family)
MQANASAAGRRILALVFAAMAGWFTVPCLPATPGFDVVSIKPAAPGTPSGGAYLLFPGGRFVGKNLPVKRLIIEAYEMSDFQVTGGPGWIDSERYDIEAKADGLTKIDELRKLTQALLADRFKLQAHRAMKNLPIYALVVAKKGSKMHASQNPDPQKPRFVSGARIAGDFPMDDFAKVLQPILGRSVVNRTGLHGVYDLNLEWTPGVGQGPPVPGVAAQPPADPNGPSLFTAIQEQLGLRLASKKGPVEILVIDQVEKPSEN